MYKSIFEKIKHYSSNPVKEFFKIWNFINKTKISPFASIGSFLAHGFSYCKELRCVFPTLQECLNENLSTLLSTKYPFDGDFEIVFDVQKKDKLLQDFLTFCQIILTCINFSKRYEYDIKEKWNLYSDKMELLDQLKDLVTNSLEIFNYKPVEKQGTLLVDISEIDVIAEIVADSAPTKVSDAISLYLCCKSLDKKEQQLHTLIDLLEPSLKKYENQDAIKKIKEYVQLVRHPEIKKEETMYFWFFKNKKPYLDKIFYLCLYVQQYSVAKDILESFDTLKKEKVE